MEQEKSEEIWRNVPGCENYQASNMGRVRSVDRTVVDSMGRERFYRGRILGGNVHKTTGYRQFTLNINNKSRNFTASQIIAMTFLDHTPDGHTFVIDHVNGVKTDDRACNLRIVSHRANTSTCFRKDRKTLSSRYVGVSWGEYVKKWRAHIHYEGKLVYLGCYSTEIDASNAYQKALARIKDGTFNVNDYKPNYISKHKGVTFNKKNNRWQSQIRVNGKLKYLGYFNTEIEASEAYQKFKQEVKNH